MTRHTDRVRIDSDGTPIYRCLVAGCGCEWARERDCPLCQARALAIEWAAEDVELLVESGEADRV